MPQKSRRKKKYTGQRRPQVATTTATTSAPGASPAAAPREPLARPRPGTTKAPGQMAPSPSASNVGHEVRMIAVLAAAAVVVIVALSFVLR